MNAQLIIALLVATPVILFPVAFVWYLNGAGVLAAVRALRARKAHRGERETAAEKETTGFGTQG